MAVELIGRGRNPWQRIVGQYCAALRWFIASLTGERVRLLPRMVIARILLLGCPRLAVRLMMMMMMMMSGVTVENYDVRM